jgi:hypothetical protein
MIRKDKRKDGVTPLHSTLTEALKKAVEIRSLKEGENKKGQPEYTLIP